MQRFPLLLTLIAFILMLSMRAMAQPQQAPNQFQPASESPQQAPPPPKRVAAMTKEEKAAADALAWSLLAPEVQRVAIEKANKRAALLSVFTRVPTTARWVSLNVYLSSLYGVNSAAPGSGTGFGLGGNLYLPLGFFLEARGGGFYQAGLTLDGTPVTNFRPMAVDWEATAGIEIMSLFRIQLGYVGTRQVWSLASEAGASKMTTVSDSVIMQSGFVGRVGFMLRGVSMGASCRVAPMALFNAVKGLDLNTTAMCGVDMMPTIVGL